MLLEDLVAFADALGLRRFHVAGLSMGAGTALACAVTHPERVISAVLAAVGVEPEPRNSVARRLMDPERLEREEPDWAARLERRHDGVQGPGAWRRLLAAIRNDILVQPHPRPDELRRARLPILVAVGDRDPWVPLEQAVRLRRQLPEASLFVAPGVGHVLTAERPTLFNQAMLQFLRATSDRAAPTSDHSVSTSDRAADTGATIRP